MVQAKAFAGYKVAHAEEQLQHFHLLRRRVLVLFAAVIVAVIVAVVTLTLGTWGHFRSYFGSLLGTLGHFRARRVTFGHVGSLLGTSGHVWTLTCHFWT